MFFYEGEGENKSEGVKQLSLRGEKRKLSKKKNGTIWLTTKKSAATFLFVSLSDMR